MGKTFRRGGSERGNYSYGKSIRDKRTRNSKSNFLEDTNGNYKSNKRKQRFNANVQDEDWG